MNYKQGSSWYKWDLHVHTPDSLENHFSGSTPEEKWENFISDLEQLPKEMKVLGINDYLFIDGYIKILEFKSKGRLQNIDTIFPVIEFRIKKFAGHKDFKRVNFHIIFSDKLKPETIQSQFLNSLQGKYTLSPGISGINWNATVTPESLSDLGKKIKESVPPEQLGKYGSDLIEGFNNLNIDEEEILKLLKHNSYLQNKYLTAVGKTEWESLSWGSSSIAEKKDIINKADLVFISSETPEDYFNAKLKLEEQAVNNLLLDCSDAHYNSSSTLKDRIGKCFTWIKADTTFEGLRQVTFEFQDRVFIGDLPPSIDKRDKNSTKYIKGLSVRKVQNSPMPETWFDGMPELQFNSGLVAIIGNKGSGKSALTDILGLVGNSHNYEDFSFLNSQKFLKKKPYNRGSAFEASIKWHSGYDTNYEVLSSIVDYTATEKVKYLPQSFLEKICSDDIESENFEKELKQVVFSHMDETQKLGQTTFDDYIKYKTTEINLKISNLKSKNHELNKDISNLEDKEHPTFLANLEDKKKVKEEELSSHLKNIPKEVKKPDADEALKVKQEEINEKLNKLVDEKKTISEKIEEVKGQKQKLIIKTTDLQKLHQGIIELKRHISDFKERYSKTFSDYKLNADDILKFEIKSSVVEEDIANTNKEVLALNNKLDETEENSLISQDKELSKQINLIKKELSEPFRLYQKYLEELELWKVREKELTGDIDKEGSIKYYEEKIRFIKEDLSKKLEDKNNQRLLILDQVCKAKQEAITMYRDAYKPVTELVKTNSDIMEDYQIEFDASLKINNFESRFFSFINQGSKGSFSGKEEGYQRIKEIIEESSFSNCKKIKQFVEAILKKTKNDCREGRNDERRYLSEQLRKDITSIDFYNYIFGLDYLEETYQLKLGGKDLTELSPGERGALLLIFYLLLDKGDIPLVIDQPEENLDNESVYHILVKFIKKAKQRRQVIIVTHNPNLAVVCDAEQLIRVQIDKEDKNKMTYISGAIENKEINDEIVKILEGTKPAFTNRRLKYNNITQDF